MIFTEMNLFWFREINDLGKNYPLINPVFKFFAEYTVYILLIGFLYYWFSRDKDNRTMILNAAFSFILAEAAGKLAGLFYSNNQPFAELENVNQLIEKTVDNSFPSDHTILFFAISFSIWLVRKKHGSILLLFALCTAISRIGVGVHYPFDILTGALIGIFSSLIIAKLSYQYHFTSKLLSLYEKVEHSFFPVKKQSKDV